MNCEITPMKPDVAELFKKFLQKKENGKFAYPIVINDLGLTFEYLYRIVSTKNKDIPAPSGMAVALMSKEAQQWAGFTRRDPYVSLVRYPKFPHPAKFNNQTGAVCEWKKNDIPYSYANIWWNLGKDMSEERKREKLCDFITEQAALWEKETNQ